jgi:hypothetical protein
MSGSTELMPKNVGTEIKLAVTATTDDVLSIAVASHEDLLEHQRGVLQKRLTELEKEQTQLLKTMDGEAESQIIRG